MYEEDGVPVTKIAPRIGMEPNSLSRTLNTLERNGFYFESRIENDQRKSIRLSYEKPERNTEKLP
ncbi:MAG: MarR family transcriptional regulator [Chitinophagales bacterium]